jgi:hypothetical protein
VTVWSADAEDRSRRPNYFWRSERFRPCTAPTRALRPNRGSEPIRRLKRTLLRSRPPERTRVYTLTRIYFPGEYDDRLTCSVCQRRSAKVDATLYRSRDRRCVHNIDQFPPPRSRTSAGADECRCSSLNECRQHITHIHARTHTHTYTHTCVYCDCNGPCDRRLCEF